jgi:hypothetical protein
VAGVKQPDVVDPDHRRPPRFSKVERAPSVKSRPWPMAGAVSNSGEAALRDAALPRPSRDAAALPEQYLLLVTCRDERHQVERLGRLRSEGLECRPLLSQEWDPPPLPPLQAPAATWVGGGPEAGRAGRAAPGTCRPRPRSRGATGRGPKRTGAGSRTGDRGTWAPGHPRWAYPGGRGGGRRGPDPCPVGRGLTDLGTAHWPPRWLPPRLRAVAAPPDPHAAGCLRRSILTHGDRIGPPNSCTDSGPPRRQNSVEATGPARLRGRGRQPLPLRW